VSYYFCSLIVTSVLLYSLVEMSKNPVMSFPIKKRINTIWWKGRALYTKWGAPKVLANLKRVQVRAKTNKRWEWKQKWRPVWNELLLGWMQNNNSSLFEMALSCEETSKYCYVSNYDEWAHNMIITMYSFIRSHILKQMFQITIDRVCANP